MNKTNIFWVVGVIVVALILIYFVNGNKDQKVAHVAVQQTTSHVAYDQVIAGLKAGLKDGGFTEGENLVIELQNGQGDLNANQAIANKFANGTFDAYIPLGTQASQAIANIVKDKPVIFGAVTDPVLAKLVASNEAPGANITGTTDASNYKEQFVLFKRVIPNLKRVGILYNPGEANSVSGLNNIQALSAELELEFIVAPINNTNDILGAARSIAGKVDGFFTMPDNTLLAGEDALIKVALENKKPLFNFESSGTEKGGLLSIGTSYERVGYKTGMMAARVLKGEKTATMPVEGLTDTDVDVYLNQKTADLIGVTFPTDLAQTAKQVYR